MSGIKIDTYVTVLRVCRF